MSPETEEMSPIEVTPQDRKLFEANTLEQVKAAVKNGANVNARDEVGDNVLMYHMSDFEIIQFLVDNGADINAGNEDGDTLIMYAEDEDKLEFFQSLGADINKKNKKGKSALAQAREVEWAKILIQHGANLGDIEVNSCFSAADRSKVRTWYKNKGVKMSTTPVVKAERKAATEQKTSVKEVSSDEFVQLMKEFLVEVRAVNCKLDELLSIKKTTSAEKKDEKVIKPMVEATEPKDKKEEVQAKITKAVTKTKAVVASKAKTEQK